MSEKLPVARCGDGLAVHIPDSVAQAWGLREGSEVVLLADHSRVGIRQKDYSLAELLAQIDPEGRTTGTPEVDFGFPQGKEVW